jgi:membrane-associated phospholipid phosphatase
LFVCVAGCAGLFGLILALAYLSPAARELDAHALQGWVSLQDGPYYALVRKVQHLGDAALVGLQASVLAAVALLRARPRLAIAVIGLLAVTSVSSQVLKALLAYPRFEGEIGLARVAPEAFPSGHSTAAMALAIGGVMVVPARVRLPAALGGSALALAVGLSVVSIGRHFPSDVAGGFLLATAWGLLVVLSLRWAEARWPERTIRGRASIAVRRVADAVAEAGVAALVIAGGLLLMASVVAAALTRPGDAVGFAREHTSALLVGSGLVALAVGLLGGVAQGFRRRG